jgi:Mrp family chromosome partitioning ATPase
MDTVAGRNTAVLDDSLTPLNSRERSHSGRSGDRQCQVYGSLLPQLFGSEDRGRVIAFAAAGSDGSVKPIAGRVMAEVARATGIECSLVTAVEFSVLPPDRLSRTGSTLPNTLMRTADSEGAWVLVDGGWAAGGEMLAIASRVDAVILVVEAGRTGRREVRRALAAVAAAGGRVAGLVLHRRGPALPRWLARVLGRD